MAIAAANPQADDAFPQSPWQRGRKRAHDPLRRVRGASSPRPSFLAVRRSLAGRSRTMRRACGDPSLTKEQAFAKVYTDPKNRNLVHQEGPHGEAVGRATWISGITMGGGPQ